MGERGDLTQITRKGSHKSQRVTNALIPLPDKKRGCGGGLEH